jgi:hypothetical protein
LPLTNRSHGEYKYIYSRLIYVLFFICLQIKFLL